MLHSIFRTICYFLLVFISTTLKVRNNVPVAAAFLALFLVAMSLVSSLAAHNYYDTGHVASVRRGTCGAVARIIICFTSCEGYHRSCCTHSWYERFPCMAWCVQSNAIIWPASISGLMSPLALSGWLIYFITGCCGLWNTIPYLLVPSPFRDWLYRWL